MISGQDRLRSAHLHYFFLADLVVQRGVFQVGKAYSAKVGRLEDKPREPEDEFRAGGTSNRLNQGGTNAGRAIVPWCQAAETAGVRFATAPVAGGAMTSNSSHGNSSEKHCSTAAS